MSDRSVVIGHVDRPGRPQWPLNQEMNNSPAEELCVRHMRWTPCLGNHSRYDSKVRECHVSTDKFAGILLRQHHEGKMSKEELEEAFSHITNYTVQMTTETVES